MNRRKRWIVAAALILLPAIAGLAAVRLMKSPKPDNLGPVGGKLRPCPATPNCVGTQAELESQRMAPIPFVGSRESAIERLKRLIDESPRAEVVRAEDGYLHAEFVTPVLGFVDDVEFLIDEQERLVHFRSASRIGRSDLGVNRRRMTRLTQRFQGQVAGEPAEGRSPEPGGGN